MPKKKKNGQGARAADLSGESSSDSSYPESSRSALPGSVRQPAMSGSSSQSKDEILKSMQEMFSHLDPVVIYLVLSEADFKVDNAMDALLELSDGVEGNSAMSVPASGFEVAAALLESLDSQLEPSTATSAPHRKESRRERSPETTRLTEEFDSLIDRELETLMMPQVSPAQKAPTGQEALLELDQLDAESGLGSSACSIARAAGTQECPSPIDELSLGGVFLPQNREISVDFSHLTTDSRPSAFTEYLRPDPFTELHPEGAPLNIHALEFQPHQDDPVFVTPVVQAPNPWTANSAAGRLTFGPIVRAPLKPSASVLSMFPRTLRLEGQVLVLLRGAPGAGKSTLASAMLEQNPGGIVLCTDEYFTRNGVYRYEAELLGEAHAWNHRRAKAAFEKGLNPIIIDNTNMQCWEMKPYVAMALQYKYRVLFREPNTWWKTKPRELEKRTKHGVTKEKIRRMLENQDRYVTIQNIMASQPIPSAVYGVEVPQYDPALHPELEGRSGRPGDHPISTVLGLSSSDPTPSNIDAGEKKTITHKDPEEAEALQSEIEDGAELDSELDACIALSESTDWNENHELSEKWVVEECLGPSIGQRVRREREHRGLVQLDICANETSDGSSRNSLQTGQVGDAEQDCSGNAFRLNPEKLDFLGDWPTESLEQRRPRSLKSPTVTGTDGELSDSGDLDSNHRGETESVKLVDLLQGSSFQGTQETTQDCQCSSPASEAQTILPDCVLDWSSVAPTDPGDNGSSSFKELEPGQYENSECATKVESTVIHTPINNETGLPEKKDEPIPDPTLILASKSEVCKERKRGSTRRAGKSCKLALTFSRQSPSSIQPHTGSPVGTVQPADQTPPTHPSASTQTDPQEFALLWRINQQKCSEPESTSSTSNVVIFTGHSLHFVPKLNLEISSGQHVVPYRVCHEKGTQVEENHLGDVLVKERSLEILRCHFKHVPPETLEDLYEKCHQDMEWTTNLLLDSGECLHRGDEDSAEAENDNVTELDKEPSVTLDAVTKPTCSGQIIDSTNDGEPRDVEQLDFPEQGEITEVLEEKPGSTAGTHPSQPGAETRMQDSLTSHSVEPEIQSVPLSVSQGEVAQEHLDEGLVDDVGDNREADRETKEEEVSAVAESLSAQLKEIEQRRVERRKERREREKERRGQSGPMNIQTLELKLTTELALQLTELFGPVGISPGEFSQEDCSVLMDLNLARLLHQKWKETIQERQREAALSYHLLQESSLHWGESQAGGDEWEDSAAHFLIGAEGYSAPGGQSGVQEGFSFMDHWNVAHPAVSLRDIMMEEQVMQDSLNKSNQNYWDLDKKDGAAILKEKQLFSLFPTIDRHFLSDIFKDYNYSLEQTVQFLHTLLDDGPVKNVVASEVGPEVSVKPRAPSKERKQKAEKVEAVQFQDTEDPEYEDFRTEAVLQRRRQLECFDKAAEAYRRGRKDVASFYAQQGHLHGQKMREANHRSAVQIFERVNATLLPQNVLDLHGLHVDEALHHLQQVLADKTSEWQQGLCRPQLSVITGRGNRSQGGVARIRPAVLDYLKSKHYRYVEIKPGLVVVTLH